jgi:hypothetical protein
MGQDVANDRLYQLGQCMMLVVDLLLIERLHECMSAGVCGCWDMHGRSGGNREFSKFIIVHFGFWRVLDFENGAVVLIYN